MRCIGFWFDVSAHAGLGHINRCLTLAREADRRGINSIFIYHGPDKLAKQYLPSQAPHIQLAEHTDPKEEGARLVRILADHHCNVCVIDHYRTPDILQKVLHDAGVEWMQFDYRRNLPSLARWLVNINPAAEIASYAGIASHQTQLLLGPKYAVLREEFFKHRPPHRPTAKTGIKRILLSFGGGDDRGATLSILSYLSALGLTSQVDIVSTQHNPNLAEIKERHQEFNLPVSIHVQPAHFAEIALACDLAITTAGTTSFELACLGVPSANLVIAENQQQISESWAQTGVSINLGLLTDITQEGFAMHWQSLSNQGIRQELATRGWSTVDGLGAIRLIDVLDACP